ncbi:MAG: RICIN domain-containing protein, partial [Bacteroidia bacterium]
MRFGLRENFGVLLFAEAPCFISMKEFLIMKMKHFIRITLLCSLILLQQAFLCGSLSAQGFRPNPNAFYKITNAHQGRALCTLHNSGDPANKGNQEPIIQHDYYGDATQKWKFKDNGDGSWAILNAHSGKALCTLHNSVDPAYKGNQEPIIQFDNYGDATQKWVLNDVGNGLVSISNRKDGRALCTMHNSGDPANKGNQEAIIIHDYYGDATQKWRIEEIGQAGASINGGKYYIQARHSGKYLTTGNNASPVTQKSMQGDGWQQWIFEPDGNGWYAIKSVKGPYVMSISECSTKEGAGLITWQNDGGDCQKFKLVSKGDGWYNIIGQKANMAIDVSGGNNDEGGHVCQWFTNNGFHQQWKLVPVNGNSGTNTTGSSGGVTILGSKSPMTGDQIRSELSKRGLTLVTTGTLQPNQCAVFNPKVSADGSAASAQMGCLVCATQISDNVTLNTAAVYGACDASLSNGAGGACEIAVATSDLYVKANGTNTHFSVKGPSASACGSISADRMCANTGATWASTSVMVTDDAGNGIGIGVDNGVGAGINGAYEDGVLSFGVNLKFLAGGSITFSVNPQDLGTKLIKGGSAAYIYTKGKLTAAGSQAKSVFSNIGSDVKTGASVAAVAISREGQKAWGTVSNEVSDWGNSVGAFFKEITGGAKLNRELAPGEAYLSVFNQSGYVVTTHVDFQHPLGNKSIDRDLSLGMTAQFF